MTILIVNSMKLLNELLEFKDTKDFKKYGFAIGGPFNVWFKKAENLYNETNKAKYGHLMTLGMHYATSQGKETKITKKLKKELM